MAGPPSKLPPICDNSHDKSRGPLGSTANPLASVPEGGAPAFDSGATWRLRDRAFQPPGTLWVPRCTDREPFTWQRFLCQNGQGSDEHFCCKSDPPCPTCPYVNG